MKIPNKSEHQQIALNHSSDTGFADFMKIYKKCTSEPYSFLVNDTTLPSDNFLRFRKSLLNKYNIESRQLMIRPRIKKYNMRLLEKLQKYHQAKLASSYLPTKLVSSVYLFAFGESF